jgi:hypothetical protein
MAGSLDTADLATLLTRDERRRASQLQRLLSATPAQLNVFARTLAQNYARETVTLPDSTTGYFERGTRSDDCFAACVATCLQVPLDEVPDPRIDERLRAGETANEINHAAWHEIESWLAERRLRIVRHETPCHEPRWLGVVNFPGDFNDHCLVMAGDQVLFDPVDRSRHSREVRTFSAADVAYGISFQPIKETSNG